MYRKAYLVESVNSLADSIDQTQIGLLFENMLPQYTPFIDEETNDEWLIDNDLSQTPHPASTLIYSVIGGSQGLISTSMNFIGTIPHRPK